MAGKRIGQRAHHGPEEDRARKPAADRQARLRVRDSAPNDGLTAKDRARKKAWEES